MIEYNKNNQFPFYTHAKKVSIQEDDHEEMYELKFIYDKIVGKYPALRAEEFYGKMAEIQKTMKSENEQVKCMKAACDKLLHNIKHCISDENFIHLMHDQFGFGIDKVIGTLYAVYGYYFYTGKRTANVIKKTLDGYKRKPVH